MTTVNTNGHDFDTAFALLSGGDGAGAYLLFSKLAKDDHIAAHFNLGLCLFNVDKERALGALQNALSAMNRMMPPSPQTDTACAQLLAYSEGRYLCPMPEHLPEILPHLARENIKRLMIDLYASCEVWDKVISLSQGLMDFENVKKALENARGK